MQNMNISRMTAAMFRTRQSILAQRLQDADLNGGQTDCLYAITRHEGCSQMELTEILFNNKSATAKSVKVLIEKGYVRREVDGQDKRLCHLFLTEQGRALAPKLQMLYGELVQLHEKYLTAEEAAQLAALMEKVLTGLLREREQMESEKLAKDVHENEESDKS